MDSVYMIKDVLKPEQVEQVLGMLNDDAFVDGKTTAVGMAQSVKTNEQIDAEKIPGLTDLLSKTVVANRFFRQLAMPRAVSNIMVSRYREGMEYGTHTDAAIMPSGNRSDISFTLFLTGPDSYEGGELSIETPFGDQQLKLNAGSLILYPTGELHRVMPVTKGERIVVVGWVQSRVRDSRKRQILIDLDTARQEYLKNVGHDRSADLLLKSTTNLRRMWDE
ncbi:MAG: Fe2+-dependent dioxygenase [Oceanospirillaceae bacterium]|nr:Fe2+-dependent dioxygenase [Oceanospirillaceae bacterium]